MLMAHCTYHSETLFALALRCMGALATGDSKYGQIHGQLFMGHVLGKCRCDRDSELFTGEILQNTDQLHTAIIIMLLCKIFYFMLK